MNDEMSIEGVIERMIVGISLGRSQIRARRSETILEGYTRLAYFTPPAALISCDPVHKSPERLKSLVIVNKY